MPLTEVLTGAAPYIAELAGIGLQGAGNKKQRQWAAGQNHLAREYQTEMWHMTNAYNSPKAQMERLKAGGLNPNLIYGSGGQTGGTASPMSMPRQESYGNPYEGINLGESLSRIYDTKAKALSKDLAEIEIASKAQQIAESMARTAKTSGVDTDKAYADIKKTEADTKRTGVQTEADQQQLSQAYRLADVTYESAMATLDRTRAETIKTIIDASQMPERHKAAMNESASRIKEAGSRMGVQGVQRQLEAEKLKMRQKGIETSDPIWARVASNIYDEMKDADAKGAMKKIKSDYWKSQENSEKKRKSGNSSAYDWMPWKF